MRRQIAAIQKFSQATRVLRLFSLAVVIAMAFSLLSAAAMPVSAAPGTGAGDLDQCLNGTLADPKDCIDGINPNGWVNGNANSNQSHWTEGQSLPFRMRLTGLVDGQNVLTIRYDYTSPTGEHAYDYLTTYDRSAPTADPCSGFLAPCPAPSTFPIPIDPVLATCQTPQHAASGVPQLPGVFTIYNGVITGAAYLGTHACHGNAIQVSMLITFTSSAPDAVIAWSAHIAPEFDWGNNESAHSISGSPYHMTFIDLNGSGGNQDRSMQTGAVYATNLSTTVSSTDLTSFAPVYDTAHLYGFLGNAVSTTPAIEGTLNFYICSDTVAPYQPPFVNGCDHTSGTLLNNTPIVVNGNGDYQSPSFTPTQDGYYCFRSEFIPSGTSPYPFARETNASKVNPYAECFLVSDPLPVSITSLQVGNGVGAANYLLIAAATLLLGISVVLFDSRFLRSRK